MSIMIEISDQVARAIHIPESRKKAELLQQLAISLYQNEYLSFGKAREMAGQSKLQFAFTLQSHNVPRHYGADEFHEDLCYAGGK
jgi:predicted HTH domain antitoxin